MAIKAYDLTIIGAGPAGLYAAYYGGFRGLSVKLVDSLSELGGQVTALYPDKLIYDVAGFPQITGRDLVKNLIDQAMQYNPDVFLNERVLDVITGPDKIIRFVTQIDCHASRAIIITTGMGAFDPKPLPATGADRFPGKGLAYFVRDIRHYEGKRVVVVGGGDSAVDWALNFLKRGAASVTLVHRRDGFRAHEDSVQQLKNSKAQLKLFFEVKELRGKDHLENVVIASNKGGPDEVLPADEILPCLGFDVSTGPLVNWGLTMHGKDIPVTSKMGTNLPGVYAAGDVAWYEGKAKLISTGFGEAATAVNNAAAYLKPGTSVFPGHSSTKGRLATSH
jgi:thioredoxin reductase (NADPH)